MSRAIEAFMADYARSASLDLSPNADGPMPAAGDVIAEVLQWVEMQSGHESAMSAIRSGLGKYASEAVARIDDVDALGPEPHVTVDIVCGNLELSVSTNHAPDIAWHGRPAYNESLAGLDP